MVRNYKAFLRTKKNKVQEVEFIHGQNAMDAVEGALWKGKLSPDKDSHHVLVQNDESNVGIKVMLAQKVD